MMHGQKNIKILMIVEFQ